MNNRVIRRVRATRREFLGFIAGSAALLASDSLLEQWRAIAATVDGVVGATVLDVQSGWRISLNGQALFPLASVCKLSIAIRVLAMVDEGKLREDQMIEVLPRDVWRSWEGDIGDGWPAKRRFMLDELLERMVAHSDNTAVHTLFRIAGEREGMAASFRKWNIEGFRVDRYEGQCFLASHGVTGQTPVESWQPNAPVTLSAGVSQAAQLSGMRTFLDDPRDTATPEATVALLAALFRGSLLSPSSTTRILRLLQESKTGRNRIRGLLPSNLPIGDKTGTTDTVGGLNGATNDAGLIMPNHKDALAIAVYIKGSTHNLAARERVIARIASSAYESWKTTAKS